MATAENWANVRHPKPGNDRAMRQKKAIASGYAMAPSPSPVKLHQTYRDAADCAKVPGIGKGCK